MIRNGERQRETVATCLLNLPLIIRYNESIEELPDIGFELPEPIKSNFPFETILLILPLGFTVAANRKSS